jgi:HK97 gp10 family phage protein
MPDRSDVQIEGLKELLVTLRELSSATQDTLSYRAAAKAARLVVRSAQANIQSYGLIDTGALIGNVAMARQKPNGLVYSYDIGVRHGTKKQIKTDDDPWYWWLLEFGTVNFEGRHFLTQAFAGEKEEALEAMRTSLTSGIERTVAKTRKTGIKA